MIDKNYPKLRSCPFCRRKDAVTISVCDDEGNYHGEIGCDYEQDPWSGLSYALVHEGWGRCILCINNEPMGRIIFDTAEDAAEVWNRGGLTIYSELIKRLRKTSCGAEDTLWWQAADAIEELQQIANNLLVKYEREASSMVYAYDGCIDFDYLQKEIRALQAQIDGKSEPLKEE